MLDRASVMMLVLLLREVTGDFVCINVFNHFMLFIPVWSNLIFWALRLKVPLFGILCWHVILGVFSQLVGIFFRPVGKKWAGKIILHSAPTFINKKCSIATVQIELQHSNLIDIAGFILGAECSMDYHYVYFNWRMLLAFSLSSNPRCQQDSCHPSGKQWACRTLRSCNWLLESSMFDRHANETRV